MNKNDWLDVIVKGFGVCLLVLAIIQLSNIVEGIYSAFLGGFVKAPSDSSESVTNIYAVLRSSLISKGIGSTFRFILYLIAAVNFLRSGSLVKRFMGRADVQESKTQA
ncbi:MAG: hypothetical protein WC374_10035 [Phycisphaerae bacterium]